jgi:hypothetical protein
MTATGTGTVTGSNSRTPSRSRTSTASRSLSATAAPSAGLVAMDHTVDHPAVMLILILRPARVGDLSRGGAVARRLRAAVASAASVSPLLVFVSAICDPSGRQTRFADSDAINAPDAYSDAENYDTLLDGLGGEVAAVARGREGVRV